jgi:tetratricopeptide (TPR) repeat protein
MNPSSLVDRASDLAAHGRSFPTASGSPALDGVAILREIPDDVGVLLWQSVRNVRLWAAAEPEARGRLFREGAGSRRRQTLAAVSALDAEAKAALRTVAGLLESPGKMGAEGLGKACQVLARWAASRGADETALAFAEAAASASPATPLLAYEAGRLARARAEYARAEHWFTEAIRNARRQRDWKTYALGFSGLGNVHVRKGNFPAARQAHLRCLRAARRHSLLALQGEAHHDLFMLAVETGAGREADEHAAAAFSVYGAKHRKLPRLAYDVAYQWTMRGCFAPALALAEALLPHFDTPAERVLALGLVARAAGGAGERERFAAASGPVRAMEGGPAVAETLAGALLGVAYGAMSLGEREVAREAAERAAALAHPRQQGYNLVQADALLERARAHLAAPPPEDDGAGVQALAETFVEVLRRRPVGAGGR